MNPFNQPLMTWKRYGFVKPAGTCVPKRVNPNATGFTSHDYRYQQSLKNK